MYEFECSTLSTTTKIKLQYFVTEDNGIRIFLQNGVNPILQNGPQCGIVALSMALNSLGKSIEVEHIFQLAKSCGFSKQGEIFSAENLSNLCNKLHTNSSVVELFPSALEVTTNLMKGYKYLLAYDCDKNYSAAKLNGHKAHWLLLCGFFSIDRDSLGILTANSPFENEFDLYLLGYHGKSKSIAIFPYTDLLESNSQLKEAGPVRGNDDYVIECINDLSGLRGKVVKIKA